MNSILQFAARTVVRTLAPVVRTKLPAMVPSPMLRIEHCRFLNVSAALCKRNKKGEKVQKPVCGQCHPKVPVKFPLCTKRTECITGKKTKKKKGCKNFYPMCKNKDMCPYVDPRAYRDAMEARRIINEGVKWQVKEEKRLRGKHGKGKKKHRRKKHHGKKRGKKHRKGHKGMKKHKK